MTPTTATIARNRDLRPDLRLLMATCSLLLLLAMWVYCYVLLSNARTEAIDKANQDATMSVRLLAEFTRHLVQANEQLMQVLLERHARLGKQLDISAYLKETGLELPLHTGLWLVDADGAVLSSNLPATGNLRQLEAFRYQAGEPVKKLYISRPLQDPDSRRWEIHLSQRIPSADGKFNGVIIASIDLQNFNRFYNEIHLNVNDALTLVGDDGIIRARKSGIATSLGLDVSKGTLFPYIVREGNGLTTSISVVDGRTRYYAFRKLASYGLYVMMGIDLDDSLQPYLTRERNTLRLASIATLIMALVGLLIHNLLGRLLRSRQQAMAANEVQQQLLRDMERQRSALEDSNQQLQAIWANTADAMLITDERHRVESVNPAASRLFAAPVGQLAGRPLQNLVPPLRLPDQAALSSVTQLQSDAAPAAAASAPLHAAVECRRPDGSSFPAELAWGRFHVGTQPKWILSLHDTTERTRIEQMKTGFVATVSEELRAPLSHIRTALAATLCEHRALVSEPVLSLLQSARLQGERLHCLINDLLDVHELEVGKMHFALQRLPLAPLLNHALGSMQEFAALHGVPITLVGGIPHCTLEVDPDRFEQVLHNLLSNACKFSAGHSNTVTVQANLITRHRVRIAIIDRGPGIAEEVRATLFEKFTHAPNETAPGKTGAGLGLMLAKVIVEHMHGELGYHSVAGQGTTFHIELPADPA